MRVFAQGDIQIFIGDFHLPTPIPVNPGQEKASYIDKVGVQSRNFVKGEKVTIDPITLCGKCPACQEGHYPASTLP
jgi:(R,R)-butanediol dehydrogenase/meso-butanediol dehydrogenase/diacetyl reductase/L-iditol 2-dehydrogenase